MSPIRTSKPTGDQSGSREPRFTLPGDDRLIAESVATVIAALEADIIAGRILPRNRLIEDHLMEDYGAKRHVVRAALEELERLGVVVKPRYRGAELRRFDQLEIDRLYDMREVLHRAAVARISVPSADALKPILHWLEAHASASREGDLVAIHRTNMMFHDAFFALCDNPFLVASIRQHDWLSFPIRAYGVANADALAQACVEHRTLVTLLTEGRMEELEHLTISHMARARRLYEEKFLANATRPRN